MKKERIKDNRKKKISFCIINTRSTQNTNIAKKKRYHTDYNIYY